MVRKKGFTLIELLVVIAIIAILLSVLMPSLSMVKEQARGLTCSARIKQLTTGLLLYANDYNGQMFPVVDAAGSY